MKAIQAETPVNGDEKKPKAKILVAASAVSKTVPVPQVARPQLKPREEVETAVAKPAVGPGDVARGRSLLGSMLIHLTSARRRLQMDRSQKPKLLRPQAKAAKSIVKETPKPKSQVKQQLVARRTRLAEQESLESRLAEHYSHMMNFIRTRAEPILFYLPAKHTPETQKCLEETQETISRKIQVLAAHLGTGEAEEAVESEKEDQDAGDDLEDAGETSLFLLFLWDPAHQNHSEDI